MTTFFSGSWQNELRMEHVNDVSYHRLSSPVDRCKFKQYQHHLPLMHCQVWPGYYGRQLTYYTFTLLTKENILGRDTLGSFLTWEYF